MNYTETKDGVELVFPERVTSANASQVAVEVKEAVGDAAAVIIDLQNTAYLSSAGLRVILALKKSGHDVKLIHAIPEVYEILETTGFTEIFPVSRKRRQISLDGAVQIGSGYSSRVYKLDGDTIVKVFILDTSLEDIQRELNLAKRAFVLGVPTAISYDVVDVDGRFGVVFELLGVGSLREHLMNDPEHREDNIGKYIRMMKTINSTDVGNMALPKCDAIIRQKLDGIKDSLSQQEYARMSALLDTIPEGHTFVHGDCHVKNVMVSGNELLMIDMDTLSAGNPIYELTAVFTTYEMFEQVWPGNNVDFLGVDRAICQRIEERLLQEYFTGLDEAARTRNQLRIYLMAAMNLAAWFRKYMPEDRASFEKALVIFRNYLGSVADLKLEGL